MWLRFFGLPLALLAGSVAGAVLILGLLVVLAYPNLPELGALTAYQPKVPLRIYSAEGTLIGEFGEERRAVVSISEVPSQLKNAIIAAEDERFYQHPGIDYIGVLRAAYANLVADVIDARMLIEASTITDRKSTRLNSSHLVISYAVFCL